MPRRLSSTVDLSQDTNDIPRKNFSKFFFTLITPLASEQDQEGESLLREADKMLSEEIFRRTNRFAWLIALEELNQRNSLNRNRRNCFSIGTWHSSFTFPINHRRFDGPNCDMWMGRPIKEHSRHWPWLCFLLHQTDSPPRTKSTLHCVCFISHPFARQFRALSRFRDCIVMKSSERLRAAMGSWRLFFGWLAFDYAERRWSERQ